MPFTDKLSRKPFETSLEELLPQLSHKNHGDITYVLYKIVDTLWKREQRWRTACVLLGCLVGTLLCFFMKHVWKYELKQLEENGDV